MERINSAIKNDCARETTISEGEIVIKTEPQVLIEHDEETDFDSDESAPEPTYLSDDIPATSSFLRQVGIKAGDKKLRATLSPTSDSQSEIIYANENAANKIKGTNNILFNSFFSIIEKREDTKNLKGMGGIIAQCRICFKKIKGSLRVSSNFIRHLRSRHAEEYNGYEKNKKSECKENVCKNFDKRVLMFLATTLNSLSVIESPEFKSLFKGFPVKLKCRRVMTNILEENHATWVLNMKRDLKDISYFSTTADVWSSRQASFFCYTCHYITPASLERKHLALACRRFRGSYTSEKIVKIVNQIHRDFGIDESKIILSTTDNISNFYEALKEFGISKTLIREDSDSDDDVDGRNDELKNSNLALPHHFSGVIHTLNELATTDFLKIIKSNENLYYRHKQAFERCSNIWRKGNRPKTAEMVENVLSSVLKTPIITHWNSLYDGVKSLLNHKDKLLILCTELGITKLSCLDVEYLERYTSLMEPVSNAIDFLEKQEHMYFGYFIAAIISLKVKLQRFLENGSQGDLTGVCGVLVNALVQRFEAFFKDDDVANVALLASMSHPAVKLRFLPILQQTAPHLTIDALKQMFVERASLCSSVMEKAIVPKTTTDIGFLDFGEIERASKLTKNDDVRKELDMYLLDDETSLNSLNKYPLIKQMFLKFNTPLPSSAPVGRLFPFSAMANAPERNNLSDSNLEMLVLLRANNF